MSIRASAVGWSIAITLLIGLQSGSAKGEGIPHCHDGGPDKAEIQSWALDAETTLPIDSVHVSYEGINYDDEQVSWDYPHVGPCGNGFNCYESGLYNLTFTAPGYLPVTIEDIVVGETDITLYFYMIPTTASPPTFRLVDSSGLVLLIIDEKGDARIRGGVTLVTAGHNKLQPTAAEEFRVVDEEGDTRIRLDDSGKLFVTYLHKNQEQSTLNGGTPPILRIKNSTGDTVAKFTPDGVFMTLGCVAEGAPP